MALWATDEEDGIAGANIGGLDVLEQNAIVGRGCAIQCASVCLVNRRVCIVFLIVIAVHGERVLHVGHSDVGELEVFLATSTKCAVAIDTCLQTNTGGCTIHRYFIKPNVLDIFGEATDGGTMTCAKVAVPNVDVLSVIVAYDIVVTITDITVVDVDVRSPDGNTISIVRSLALACFRCWFADSYIVNGSVVSSIAVTDGDVYSWCVLNFEVAD